MQFTADEDFGDNSEYDFNVFENYKPLDSLNGFRVRANNDWGNSNARMKDVINNRLAAQTHIVTPAYWQQQETISHDEIPYYEHK